MLKEFGGYFQAVRPPPKGKALESVVRSPPWERRHFMWLSKWLTDQSQVCSGNRMGLGDGALEGSGLCWGVPTRHPRHPPEPRRRRSNGPQWTDGRAGLQEAMELALASPPTSGRARIRSPRLSELPKPPARGLLGTSCLNSLAGVFCSSSSATAHGTGCP